MGAAVPSTVPPSKALKAEKLLIGAVSKTQELSTLDTSHPSPNSSVQYGRPPLAWSGESPTIQPVKSPVSKLPLVINSVGEQVGDAEILGAFVGADAIGITLPPLLVIGG